jgi:uncharacterized protein
VKPLGRHAVYRENYVESSERSIPVSQEARSYGLEPEPGPRTTTMSPKDENAWSALAHLSVLLNLFTGFLGPVAALVIWLVYRDRSPRVTFHALQSLWYQAAWIVILAVGWTVTGLLTIILVGFLLFPVMIVLSFVPFVHMAYAAYKVSQGVDYRYPLVADLVDRNRRTGIR